MITTTSATKTPKNHRNTPFAVSMIAFLIAIFSYQFNASMLSPALPSIAAELHVNAEQISSTQTVFFTSSAIFSLFLPSLGDSIGRKKTTIGMLATSTVGCIISAIAPNLTLLMIGRALQGVTGPIISLCLLMLRNQVQDNHQYARLLAVVTCTNGGIAGLDALAGGWLANASGYKSVFWTMAITGAVGIILISISTQESSLSDPACMDWPGIGALGVAVSTLLVTLTILRSQNVNPAIPAALCIVSIVGFVAFWRIERASAHPLAPIPFLTRRSTTTFLLTTTITMSGVFALMNGIIPAFAQDKSDGLGMDAASSTLVTLVPYAITGMIMAVLSGILASKIGYIKVFRIGLAATAAVTVFGIFAVNAPSIGNTIALSALLGVGYVGIVNIMINALAIDLSAKTSPGLLPGLNAAAFNLASGISYLALYGAQSTAGYAGSMVTSSVILLAAFMASLLIRHD